LNKVKILSRAFGEAKHIASVRLQSTIDIDGLQDEPAGPISTPRCLAQNPAT